jgi:hypothetical protein
MTFAVAQAGVQTGSQHSGGVAGTVYHLVGVYDGATVRLYRDKIASSPGALVGAVIDTGVPLSVGTAGDCVVEDLRIYSRVLSAAEIAEHYDGIFRDESGLVGHWPFDDGIGTTATDVTLNANHGTLANGASWVADLMPEKRIRLAAAASSVPNAYVGMQVRITGGTGAGQQRTIQSYDGASKVACVDIAWDTTPDSTSVYDIDDSVNVAPDPVGPFTFRMDVMSIDKGEQATITLSAEDRRAGADRPRIRRYTDEDHQLDYPGDRFFDMVPELQDREILF